MRTGGYEALNYATIAEELGVTRANVYYHFKGKENLALEAIGRYMDEIEGNVRARAGEHPGDFPAVMEALDGDVWRQLADDDFEGWCVAVKVIADQSWVPRELGHKATEHFERLVDGFAALVEESQDAGTVRTDRPAADLAREALMVHLGIAQMAMSVPGEREPGSFSRRYMKTWLTGIAPVAAHADPR